MSNRTRSQSERSYVKQGFRLPDGLTWSEVDAIRARWDIESIFVPVARSPGCIGWGVPFRAGKPLKHP
jgi:hypothetical protein